MALVLTVGTTKGGSGKTTICALLASVFAAKGFSVRILDADPQATATQWFARSLDAGRALENIAVDVVQGADQLVVALAAASQADVILIDVPGVVDEILNIAAGHSEMVLIPARASGADLPEVVRLLARLDAMYEGAKPFLTRCVLNGVSGIARNTAAFKIAAVYIEDHAIPMTKTIVVERPILQLMMMDGGALATMPGDSEQIRKAMVNGEMLADEIFETITAAGAQV
jgi:chromosome partitioning protein